MKARVPTPLAQQVFDQAEAEGIYASDLIAEMIAEHLPERIAQWQAREQKQEVLPLEESA